MLTAAEHAIIKATVPVLETGGEALTTHFYRIMLNEYPGVRPLFNQANQANGAQPRALANAVLMYARNIDRLENLGPLASRIVNKHVALQILPEHYPIVGTCLLRAIREVLGEEIATDEVINAWAAAYQQLADILINAERDAYDSIEAAPGGWRGGRLFRVVRKVAESAEITSFYLEPVDGRPVIAHKAGQYIGLKLETPDGEIRRNYSLSAPANGTSYRISVKRQPGGVASAYLHDQVAVGSTVELFPPSGEFTLIEGNKPLVLISGGVGITATLAMAEAALEQGDRHVVFIHYARNASVQAFQNTLDEWHERYPQFAAHVIYSEAAVGAPAPLVAGRPSVEHLQQWLPVDRDVEAYFLGPKPFMAFMKRALDDLGVPKDQSHYEFFGPAEALG
ncbi:NO-inducible flavohemoprotein [Pseudomonas cannabina]|uniref:nitric oxide dioxygenase n=3 Tax=Pseudomonas syringae group TaxID=136849 RepID=A0A3M3QFT5_PSECA|nr:MULTISPECIES: NO-inducible flavohemoprotein [Pseudomonas syringae group]KPB76976.1 Bifunctional nitric oxide dioxygenase/dihydropteridine reductase 2 [Pseudomonas syringae pv. maculicola]KPW21089.1 Bifunctional nitric oxide dioxygenase/dihydropteridine reductase 2 [Pseudomonas cannabina pv. alisalensis]MBM0138964.1 NO-inducible flavohemoprotein [Pseudomonas cannabina pv. alisalensis]QHE96266.1 NO-inducible flavohemoprotein [Pseudomonas syringae pv. maculicola str. ES4326]QQN20674.1 NO-induc